MQGFLVDEAPTGYFGTQTEEALKLWHTAHGISAQPGTFDVPGRTLYAKARLAQPLLLRPRALTGTRVAPVFAEARAACAGQRTRVRGLCGSRWR